jgi:hypothetical protein
LQWQALAADPSVGQPPAADIKPVQVLLKTTAGDITLELDAVKPHLKRLPISCNT